MPTLFSNIVIIDQVISTNAYAAALLKAEKAKEGTVIFANFQTKGEGQRGAHWESEYEKNILTSMVIAPNVVIENQFDINISFSLGLYDFFFQHFKKEVKIKWPNDILIGNKKIAGSLIKNITQGKRIKNVIIGIGINVNQTQFSDFPTKATSFALELEKDFEITSLQEELIQAVENRYLQFKEGEIEKIKSEYLKNLFAIHKWREYKIQDVIKKAKIIGINDYGHLILEFQDTSIKTFSLKEIKYLI